MARIGLDAIKHWWLQYRSRLLWLATAGIVVVCLLVIGAQLLLHQYGRYVLQPQTSYYSRVGLVLGAGVAPNGKPFKELQARLDVAAEALAQGRVDKLILSGDNRVSHYNEPAAMAKYLTQTKHIAPDKLQPDYAGRSTYESCERLTKVFGVRHVVIFSAGSHLPRAIFLCRHFGVSAYGVASGVEANNYRRRELLAGVKALYNVYLRGEPTILGPPIAL